MSAGGVLAVGFIAYGLGALLNAQALHERAKNLPLDSGWRDIAMDLTDPLVSLSEALHLSSPADTLDAWAGRDTAGTPTGRSASVFTLPTVAPPTTAGPPTSVVWTVTPTTVPGATPGGSTGASAAPSTIARIPTSSPVTTSSAAPSPTTTAAPSRRVPSAADPLKLYIAGDSQAQGFGQVTDQLAARSGVMTATVDVKVSSGLNRVDFFDWPARLLSQVETLRPDVVIVDFGANDQQPIVTPEGKAIGAVADPAWATEYARRVGQVMDYLSANGRKLIWVGVPNDSRAEVTARLAVIRGVFQAEAAKRPQVTFLDAWAYFESPSGGYAAYVADDSGEVKRMRANDGFHLSIDGANYLARLVFAEVTNEFQARGGVLPA